MIATRTSAEPDQPWTIPVAEADRPVALVVEDDPDTRRRIRILLQLDGWSVHEARDGQQALLLAREHVPEVILLRDLRHRIKLNGDPVGDALPVGPA